MSGQLDLFATTGAASAAPVRASRPPLADRASRDIEPLPFVSDPLIDAALSGRTLTLRGVSDSGVALATDYVRDGREFGYFDPAARERDASLSQSNAETYAHVRAEYKLGALSGRFRCPIVRVEYHDGSGGVDPKWFKGPAKCKGQSAMYVGGAGSIWIETDVTKPDLALPANTMRAWSEWTKLPIPAGALMADDDQADDEGDAPRSEWGDGGPQHRHRGPDSADRAAALAYVYRIAEAATWSWRIARDRDARTVAIRRADLALVDDAARLSRFATSTRRKLTDQQTTTVAAALPLFSGEAAAPVRPNQQPMPRVARTEPTCADCGLTWSEGCDSPDWSWRDEGFVGISACDRCGLNSCLRCRARDGVFSGTLCAACFDLPAMTDAELRMHPDVARGAYSVDAIRARLAWRYAPPTGQRCEISPAVVGFWRDHADGKHKGLTQKQIDALFATASALKYACLEDEDDAE